MKYALLLLAFFELLFARPARAQYALGSTGTSVLGLIAAGEFSKEEALYRSKAYIIKRLGPSTQPRKFQAYALAAATSGELTSLVYSSAEDAQKAGLLLAFFGNYVNEQGVRYQGYGFKEFSKAQAEELMGKLEALLKTAPLDLAIEGSNVYFSYDDLTFLFYDGSGQEQKVRVMWNGFDSEWNVGALHKTASRMVKKF
jgi:hypothetical protein